ncbi:MAG: hypothetical protein ACRDRF_18455 [Pseudonocardiaceae bacterium]
MDYSLLLDDVQGARQELIKHPSVGGVPTWPRGVEKQRGEPLHPAIDDDVIHLGAAKDQGCGPMSSTVITSTA